MTTNENFVKSLLGKINSALSKLTTLLGKRGRPGTDSFMILGRAEAIMEQVYGYYQVAQAQSVTIGTELTMRIGFLAREVLDLKNLIGAQVPVVSGQMISDGIISVKERGKRAAREEVHKIYSKFFRKYALIFMLEFSKRTYAEVQMVLANIKKKYAEQQVFYRNRPMTVLKKLLNKMIAINIKKSFSGRRSLPGDLLVPQVVNWKHLNPVYAKISGRNRRKPGSAALRNELLRRVPAFAKVIDNQFKNTELGNMRFFLKIATRYGRGTKWFWKVYSFYFGSDGVMFGNKTRRQKLRGGPGMTKKGYRTLFASGKGKWPKRDQPARPFTLLRAQDIELLALNAEEHVARKWKREFSARASMRYVRSQAQVKVVRSREHGGWTTLALKEL